MRITHKRPKAPREGSLGGVLTAWVALLQKVDGEIATGAKGCGKPPKVSPPGPHLSSQLWDKETPVPEVTLSGFPLAPPVPTCCHLCLPLSLLWSSGLLGTATLVLVRLAGWQWAVASAPAVCGSWRGWVDFSLWETPARVPAGVAGRGPAQRECLALA